MNLVFSCAVLWPGNGGGGVNSDPSAYDADWEPAADHENTGLLNKWKAWCTSSTLSFACPQLEDEFQGYQARARNILTCICMLLRVSGYVSLAMLLYNDGMAHRHMLPSLTLPLLCHLTPGIVTLALLCFAPNFYGDHVWAIHIVSTVADCCALYQLRELLLWRRLIESTPNPSFLHQVRNFASENMYFCTAWFVNAPNHVARLSVLGTLLVSIAGNPAICTSPLWQQPSVTLSSGPLVAAQAISAVLMEAAEPVYHARNRSQYSCPTLLAVWQILGSLLALLVISVAEIMGRRAFLRTPHVQARLEPGPAAEALHWPWGGMSLPSRCVASALWLFVAHAVLLGLLFSSQND